MPVSIARLRDLIDLAGSQGVESIDLVEDGTRIRITREGNAPLITASRSAPASSAQASSQGPVDVFVSPMFGVFHMTPAPGAKPYVAMGDSVVKGQQLCLIEAMKMFHVVLSDRDGRLEALLAEPGAEVASGQPLFRIGKA